MSEDDGNPAEPIGDDVTGMVEDDALARTTTRERVSGSEQRRATAHVAFRIDADHAQLLDKYARDHGMSRGPFVREIVAAYLDAPEMIPQRADDPPEVLQELRALAGELGKMGGNINQLAYRCNAGQRPPERSEMDTLEGIRKELRQLRSLVYKRMQR